MGIQNTINKIKEKTKVNINKKENDNNEVTVKVITNKENLENQFYIIRRYIKFSEKLNEVYWLSGEWKHEVNFNNDDEMNKEEEFLNENNPNPNAFYCVSKLCV